MEKDCLINCYFNINMSLCIVYLASPVKTVYRRDDTNFSVTRLECLNKSLNITRRIFPHTDIIVFHEDLLESDLPNYVNMVKINFSGLEEYYVRRKHGYGYLMMCRFFSGIMQDHPILSKYTHYMRLDDDSFFIEPCNNISINEFLSYDYIYRTTFTEEGTDQSYLYEFTKEFLANKGLNIPSFNKQNAPYNNFHVSSIRLWNEPLIKEYINNIELNKLILKEDLLDANIHAFIIWALAPHTSLKIKQVTNFGYRHNYHVCKVGNDSIEFMDNITFCPMIDDIESFDKHENTSIKRITNKRFLWSLS